MLALDLIAPNLRQLLEAQLIESACLAFRRQATPEFKIDVANHLRDGKLYIAVNQGAVVGFTVMKDFPAIDGTYISGIVKSPGGPTGIIENVVNDHVRKFKIVAVRTQNDRVVEIMSDICSEVVPLHREASLREMGILGVMGLERASTGLLVVDDLIAKQHYGGRPMIGSGERRRSSNPLVRQTTDRLKYEEGDALLLVGYR